MNCVRKVSVTECAASKSARSASPRFTTEVERTSARGSKGSVTGSSSSYSTSMSAAASRAARRVSAATAARTSPTYAVSSPTATSWRQSCVIVPCARRPRTSAAVTTAPHARVGIRLRGVDAHDACARMVGEPKRSVEHPRLDEVGDERLVAERELAALVPRRARPDAAAHDRRQARLALPERGDEPHCVDDLHVPGAAAEVAEQGVGDLLPRGIGMLRKERLGLHQDPRRAEPALRGAGGDEAVRPQAAGLLGQALLGDDLFSRDARRLLRAGDDRATVDDHRARAARALRRAAVLGRAQAKPAPQEVEEGLVLLDLDGDRGAVERQLHGLTPPRRVPGQEAPSA